MKQNKSNVIIVAIVAIVAAQSKEIAQMKRWQKTWGYSQ